MNAPDPPGWLEDFQRRFGATLRAPLDETTGTFRAAPSRYDPSLCREATDSPRAPARERLAVYNRQYWFRLFGVLQGAFPLTARLLGYFGFNQVATRYLSAHPPRGFSIDRVADAFEAFLATDGAIARGPVDARALREAARIDGAFREVFLRPAAVAYRPSAADAPRLPGSRLVPSPGVVELEEHWPLMELRQQLANDMGEGAVPLPAELAEPAAWALVRRPGGIGQLRLRKLEARLFTLLRAHTVGEALGILEAECPAAELAALPASAQAWLARSVELGFWTGLESP